MIDRVPSLDEMFDYAIDRTRGKDYLKFKACCQVIDDHFYNDLTRWTVLKLILKGCEFKAYEGDYRKLG
jgi:hypothetical protein